MPPRIVVIGSVNLDLVVRSPRLPQPGETVTDGLFERHAGGKGANQAVAAARLGAKVSMIGCVGDDEAGRMLVAGLNSEGIDTAHVRVAPRSPTGIALITVDARTGENTIVVAPGANSLVNDAQVSLAMDMIRDADVVLMQLELPLESLLFPMAHQHMLRCTMMLNAAPARPLTAEMMRWPNILVVNEAESRTLLGEDSQPDVRHNAALLPREADALTVVTLGARGCLTRVGDDPVREHGAFPVSVADTTAAGDAFCGALAVHVAEFRGVHAPGEWDWHLDDAIPFASAAAALACTKRGAQSSLPTRPEVESLLASHRPRDC
jgi:ribokinase